MFQCALVVVAGAKVQSLVGYSMRFLCLFFGLFFSWLRACGVRVYFIFCSRDKDYNVAGVFIIAGGLKPTARISVVPMALCCGGSLWILIVFIFLTLLGFRTLTGLLVSIRFVLAKLLSVFGSVS